MSRHRDLPSLTHSQRFSNALLGELLTDLDGATFRFPTAWSGSILSLFVCVFDDGSLALGRLPGAFLFVRRAAVPSDPCCGCAAYCPWVQI
jgi:hypothetical protein